LKQEFAGKAKIHIDGWPDNILNGDGKGINALKNYQLYFIPAGGTDTIKTTFTWNDNTQDIDYNLPATLKSNTVYKAEFWSFAKSGLMMQSSVLAQLKTQSAMTAVNIKGVNMQQKQTKVTSLAINIPKPIYTLYFRTSQYNTLADKINAMGSWSAGKKNSTLVISSDQFATEHFDEFETKGYTAPNGKTNYPPLLNFGIAWDDSKQNDRFASDNIYGNAFLFNLKLVNTEFGVNWIRDYRKPVKTFDYAGLYADKPLNFSETGETVAPVNNSPKVSSGGGFMMSIPVNNANKNSSVASSLSRQSVIWDREKYLQEDLKLIKDLAYAISLNAGAFYNWSPQKAETMLGNMSGSIDLSYNGLGGYTNIPWNKFYYLYTDPKYTSIINNLKNLSFTDYPHGTRNMQAGYKAGPLQSNGITKSFSY
jgi:hypothetical protein